MNKIKIVITVGDESGIGPEILLKALCSKEVTKNTDILIVGSKINLENTYNSLQSQGIKDIADPTNYKICDIKIPYEIKKRKVMEMQVFIT